jgi:hypothetical protein
MDSIEIIHLTLTAAYHEKTGNVLAASNGIRDASEQNALEPNVRGRSSSRIPPILGGHPKAATYDHFKTGHSEGLRHTH